MQSTCPLCHKLKQISELPADELVWHFPHSVAFLGPWQYHIGYCLLVAHSHAAELHHLPTAERIAYLEEMVLLGQAIDLAFRPRKLNCESLGNQVSHLHWHLFPRRADDPDTLKAVWLAFERAETDPSEKQRLQTASMPRAEIAARIRSALEHLNAPKA